MLMNLFSVISTKEMKEYREFFPRLLNQKFLSFIINILERMQAVIGFPIGIVLPEDVIEYGGDENSLRALRILGRLREMGLLTSFYTTVHEYADEPFAYVTVVRPAIPNRTGMTGKSANIVNKAATLWPALGESIERYFVEQPHLQKNEHRDSAWNQLSGPKADIFNIAGFDAQFRKKSLRNVSLEYSKDTVFRWVKAVELTKNIQIWTPLQFFSFSHVLQNVWRDGTGDLKQKEPLLATIITTGAATAHDKATATFRGLLEVIERDAFIIYWLNQISADRIDPTTFKEERFETLFALAAQYRLEVHLLYLKTDVPVHTVCAAVVDRSGIGPAVTVDAKTGTNLSDVAYAALHSKIAQRGTSRENMKTWTGSVPDISETEKIDHAKRIQLWYQKQQLPNFEHFITGELKNADQFPVYDYKGDTGDDLQTILKWFKEKEYEVLCRELVSPEVKHMTEGLTVVMVKVPKMQPLYLEEWLRSTGGSRLREVPKMLGHEVDETKEDPFCVIPHPFP